MWLPTLRVVAARCVLGRAVPSEIIAAAQDTLGRGLYSVSLAELTALRDPIMADVVRLFKSAVEELGLRMPSGEESATILTRHNMQSIVEGFIAPVYGLDQFLNECSYVDETTGMYTCNVPSIESISTALSVYAYSQAPIEDRDAELLYIAEWWLRSYCSPSIDPRWLTSTVLDLARTISEKKTFGRLPILADALMDAGCDNAQMIEHFQFEEHSSKCWLVDLLLGKK